MAGSSEDYLASIDIWALDFAPSNWAFCMGQLLPVKDNAALFSLIGILYGGDGKATFGIPDLRGRVPVGVGNNYYATYNLGQTGGAETVALTVANLPSHTHIAKFTAADETNLQGSVALPVKTGLGTSSNDPQDKYLGASGAANIYYSDNTVNQYLAKVNVGISGSIEGGGVAVANTGSSVPFDVRQPYIALNYIICTHGYYPPRP